MDIDPPGAEEARRLLDNGWRILLSRDGLGQYTALAVRDGASLDRGLEAWEDHEPGDGLPPERWPFDGPNRFCGAGATVAQALHAAVEKTLLRRLPDRP